MLEKSTKYKVVYEVGMILFLYRILHIITLTTI